MLSLLRNLNFPFFRILLDEKESSFTNEQVITIDGDNVVVIGGNNVVASSPLE